MYNFWSIAGYEYKKLLMRKIVWVTLGLMMLFSVIVSCFEIQGDYYIDGELQGSHYDMIQEEVRYGRALSGRKIDDELIREVREAGERIPEKEIPYRMKEYQSNIAPYQEIRYFIGDIVSDYKENGVDEESLYAARKANVERMWKSDMLTSGEVEYLSELEEQIETPFVYQYARGYKQFLAIIFTIGLMGTMLTAICIPVIFTEEHSRKTDQLILCSKLGKRPLFLAKAFVGITFSIAADLILCLCAGITTFIIYGADGFNAQMQLLRVVDSWPLTAGQAVIILILLSVAAALLNCVIAMALAEYLRSSVATMAVMIGGMLFSQIFNVPDYYRVPSQLWDFIPANMVSTWGAFRDRLIPFFGTYLTQWQIAPIVYILVSAIILWACYQKYRRYQVGVRI